MCCGLKEHGGGEVETTWRERESSDPTASDVGKQAGHT